MISPAVDLEAGKVYPLTLVADGYNSNPERMEVMVGKSTTPDALTTTVIAPSMVEGDGVQLSGKIVPEADGTYYIGFHVISDPMAAFLYLNSYTIGEGFSASAPADITDLAVTPEATGLLQATVSFTAPATDFAGQPMEGTLSAAIFRNGEELTTVSCQPGETVSYVDETIPERQYYTYSVVVTNADGLSGLPAECEEFVGPLVPDAPYTLKIVENGDGSLTATWDAVTRSRDGKPLDPAYISYNVYRINWEEGGITEPFNDQPITDTTYTFVPDDLDRYLEQSADGQYYYEIGICALNRDVESYTVLMGNILLGNPYEMPVVITDESYLWDADFELFGDPEEMESGDLMFFSCEADGIAQCDDDEYLCYDLDWGSVGMRTGRIQISGKNPGLHFSLYNYTDQLASQMQVMVECNGEATEAFNIAVNYLNPGEWTEFSYPLDEFAGKVVRISFFAPQIECRYIGLDNIRVENNLDNDLAVKLTAPEYAVTGMPYDVTVTVTNNGTLPAEGFSLEVLRDGATLTTIQPEALAAGSSYPVVLKETLDAMTPEAVYTAVVTYDADENPDNNAIEGVTVTRKANDYRCVDGLTGEDVGYHHLTWNPVDLSKMPEISDTENFETAESFADEYGGWTFLNANGIAKGGFGTVIPGHEPGLTFSWFVFDASYPDFDYAGGYLPHSGDKCLMAVFAEMREQTDDWAISPLLPGTAQQLSFYAKSFDYVDLEHMKVYVTTEDSLDPADYTLVGDFENVPDEWTEYVIDLPEGTKHFAVVDYSVFTYALMLDDFTFTRYDYTPGLELEGYNVYCDGVKINEATVTEAAFDYTPEEGTHTYQVTALYNLGESEPSEPLVLGFSSLELTAQSGVSIRAIDDAIVVSGAEGQAVKVYTTDGKLLYAAEGDATIPVAAGLYIVNAGNTSVKLSVR